MIFKTYPGLSLYMIAPDGYALTLLGKIVPFEKTKLGKTAKLKTDETLPNSKTKVIRRYTSEQLLKMYDDPKSEIISEHRASNEAATNPELFTTPEKRKPGRPKRIKP